MKTCTTCGEARPLEEFHLHRRRPDGRSGICKSCACAKSRAWHAANPERAKSRATGYRAAHRDEERARQKRYREVNREKVAAQKDRWYQANREHKAAKWRQYVEDHRDAVYAYWRQWRRENPERVRASNARRRVRRQVEMTANDRALSVQHRRTIVNDPCFYCGAQGEHDDHYFPLAKGGTDHWWNLVRACSPCNLSKGARCGTWFSLRHMLGPWL